MTDWIDQLPEAALTAAADSMTHSIERMRSDRDTIKTILRSLDKTGNFPHQQDQPMNQETIATETNPLTDSRLRRFVLQRNQDATGISGTGDVAEGVQFSNGWCALSWLTGMHSVGVYPNLVQLEAIHGHNGKTVVRFIDRPGDKKQRDLFENGPSATFELELFGDGSELERLVDEIHENQRTESARLFNQIASHIKMATERAENKDLLGTLELLAHANGRLKELRQLVHAGE